jgi:hypothetical protein
MWFQGVVSESRPEHDATIEVAFRARTSSPDLLPKLLAAEALSVELKALTQRAAARSVPEDRPR